MAVLPHRGEVAAWYNHIVLLLLLGATTALLFAAFDASVSAAYLLTRLRPGAGAAMHMRDDCHEKELARRYPVGERVVEARLRFRLAVRIASEVNWFIYLPFLTLLLIIPTQSSVFDAWDLPLPFAALMAVSIGLAVVCARPLRKSAERQKGEVLETVEAELQNASSAYPKRVRPEDTNAERRTGCTGNQRLSSRRKCSSISPNNREGDGPFLPLSRNRRVILLLFMEPADIHCRVLICFAAVMTNPVRGVFTKILGSDIRLLAGGLSTANWPQSDRIPERHLVESHDFGANGQSNGTICRSSERS